MTALADSLEQMHKLVKKWTVLTNRTIGFKLSSSSLMTIINIVIFLLQLALFLTFINSTEPSNLGMSNHKQTQSNLARKLPTIYVITPTYKRYVQKAELIRLSHTFMLVPNLHWIIVEDSDQKSELVSKFVSRLKYRFDFRAITHLNEQTPKKFKLKPKEPSWKHPKGVWQRNKALDWIRDNMNNLDPAGVIYFADDDNTYDLEVFNEMRSTERVSVWPVGFVGGLLVERPIVNHSSNKVESFNSMWKSERPFPFDMAGFAISLHLFKDKQEMAKFSADQPIGYVESSFLSQLVNSWDELEPRAEKCSKILVWHTKTQSPTLHEERKLTRPSHYDLEW